MMKWTDGTPVVPSRRGRIAIWIVGAIILVGLVIWGQASDPCEGKVGDELSFCLDVNYP